MRRVPAFIIFSFVLFTGCTKDVLNEDSIHGTWIKGNSTGDTLRFFKKDGKNLLAYNLSFNPVMYAPEETEYSFRNGKLALKNYLATAGDYFTIQSFEWVNPGSEFKLQGSELFPFMASTLVYFNYKKVR
jgi:hypothetical protein